MSNKKTDDEPLDAKSAIMKTFLKLGGVAAMVTWARTNKALYYQHIFPKLLPLTQVNNQVNMNVNVNSDLARQKLQAAFTALLDAEEMPPQSMDTAPPPPADEVVTRERIAPDSTDITGVTYTRGTKPKQEPPIVVPPVVPPEPSTTAKFYEWTAAGGGRMRPEDWSPPKW
jgi:hypothetical protein